MKKFERLEAKLQSDLDMNDREYEFYEILVGIQQARYDKKYHNDKELSIQETAELIGITEAIEKWKDKEVPQLVELLKFAQLVVDKWFAHKDHKQLTDRETIEGFDEFICNLMEQYKLK